MPDGAHFDTGRSSVVFTLANIVTFGRLCAVPMAFWLPSTCTAAGQLFFTQSVQSKVMVMNWAA